MTETNRYNNGKIYKLVSPHTDKIYVGSTCKKYLCQRLGCHKDAYKRWLKDNNNGYISSYELFDLGDVEIILLEIVNCNTKDELLKKEREYIDKYKDLIVNNHLRPLITKEEKKKYVKQYDKEHKEEKKQYYEKNKEEHKQYSKEYYKEHKEKINEKQKEQILCDCGVSFQKTSKAKHIRRQTHQQYINSLVSKSVLKT